MDERSERKKLSLWQCDLQYHSEVLLSLQIVIAVVIWQREVGCRLSGFQHVSSRALVWRPDGNTCETDKHNKFLELLISLSVLKGSKIKRRQIAVVTFLFYSKKLTVVRQVKFRKHAETNDDYHHRFHPKSLCDFGYSHSHIWITVQHSSPSQLVLRCWKISIINEHQRSERLKVSRVSFIDSEC